MAAADTAFTVKVDGRTFTLDRITLGDWHMFKTKFGLVASDIIVSMPDGKGGTVDVLNLGDPGVLIGLIVAALHHECPHAPISDLIAEVEGMGMDGLEFPDAEKDEEDAEAPLDKDDATEATASPAKSSKQAKRQKQPGTPR